MGAILSQEGEPSTSNPSKPCLHPVAYYSATFTLTERNYDIYERKLLAILKAIMHWRLYLIWTQEPFTIVTDHANLLYWKSLRKLNRRIARWHQELQDYYFVLQHTPGRLHTAADALSRPFGSDEGKDDNQEVTMIPEAAFVRVLDEDSPNSLENTLIQTQQQYHPYLKQLESQGIAYRVTSSSIEWWKDL